jgi:RimJ/RimL family protein N-acetyltransferase
VLSGRPEARFEAYARGFAGCGSYTDPAYRRSYGRMYEAICCVNHKQDDKFAQLFKTRPHDVVGKYVRLEALEADRHVNDLFQITCGDTVGDHKAYDPNEVWGFLPDGPFESPTEMRQSFVFQRKPNEASFAIVNNVTDRVVGAILLTSDDPANLSIQIEPPIMPPKGDGTKEQMEACFLLIDRLFAFGYRRIQIATDSQDALQRKLATRLGFTLEGVLYKHQIIKEASRDSAVAGLLNSDWSRGARTALFSKLYGNAAARADRANEKKEEEYDEQQRVLEKQKQEEAAAAAAKDKKV